MRKSALMLLVGALLILTAAPLSATPTTPPFNQCPKVGLANSCSYLFVLGSGGSVSTLFDASISSTDGSEDTLVGILNNSGVSISSFTVTGSGIGDFDLDGGTSFGNTYNSGNNFFSNVSSNSVTVNFKTPLSGSGGTDYFVLEGAPTAFTPLGTSAVVPEPATILLAGTGLIGLLLRRRHKV